MKRRINITLPPDLKEQIDRQIPPHMRSRFLEQAALERLEREEKTARGIGFDMSGDKNA